MKWGNGMRREEWAVKICKALGHPVRFKIIKFLADGPHCVCVLNEDVEFSQSNLSQHLRILREAGLVRSEKVGLRIYYELNHDQITEFILAAENIADDLLAVLTKAQ